MAGSGELSQKRPILKQGADRPGPPESNGIDARRYLLSGFLVFGRCGNKLVARPRQDRRRRYVCAWGPNLGGCGKMERLAELVEQLVTEWVVCQLSGPALSAALVAATREDQAEREPSTACRSARTAWTSWSTPSPMGP